MKSAERMNQPLTLTEMEVIKIAIWGNGPKSDVVVLQNRDCVKQTSMNMLYHGK